MLIFSKNFSQLEDFAQIVIFDHCGHVEDENFNFSKNFGPIKDFAQKLSFLTTMGIWRMKLSIFSKNFDHFEDFAQNCNISP